MSVCGGFLFGTPYALLNFPGLVSTLHWVGGIDAAGSPYVVDRPPAWIDYPVHVFPLAVTMPILLVSTAGMVVLLARHGKRLYPIWLYMLFYYPLLAIDNLRFVRYTLPLLPILAISASYLLVSLMRQPVIRIIAGPALAMLVTYAFVFSLSYVQAMARVDPRVQASIWIQSHIPLGTTMAETAGGGMNVLNVPPLKTISYRPVDVQFNLEQLKKSDSRYLIISEIVARPYLEDLDKHPEQQAFFDYVAANYRQVASFENSQSLLGVDSKASGRLSQDWLDPNPKIQIFERNGAAGTPGR